MKAAPETKIKRYAKRITEEILCFLRDVGEMVPYPFEGKYQYIRRLNNYERYKISRAFWDLKRQGLVKKVEKNKKAYYIITDLGRAKSLRYSYSQAGKKRKDNGFSTIVIFDIPEEKRKARNFLRQFLKINGFINLQKSVMIGPWELHPEFKELLAELKIDPYVSVLEGRVLVQ
ncbi:MAG: CRISPR-associated endonuclease Cas2 [Candidatus Doudnabacteria bacterium]|nr:CRISPR-associated endonuclease Cas2 [Candidatus Doudnabacteria bacterium]